MIVELVTMTEPPVVTGVTSTLFAFPDIAKVDHAQLPLLPLKPVRCFAACLLILAPPVPISLDVAGALRLNNVWMWLTALVT